MLDPIASPHSQCGLLDHDPGEGTSGANVSTWLPSTPSQRLVQIKRWKKRSQDDMFAELMQSSRTDRAQLNAWRQTIAESRKALHEHKERRHMRDESRQDAMVKLMGEQTDMLCCMVALMRERQQDHRLPLQRLYNHPPSSPSSIASSPRRPGTWRGEATGTHTLNPRGLHKQQKAGISEVLIWFLDLSFPPPPPPSPSYPFTHPPPGVPSYFSQCVVQQIIKNSF
ncbi:uncharacterized protein LOC122465458 [Chelonia mydas]|uniref:uncharacterized protein LOC122465458 n=1 Tax=Chelonia mydas TaxID=8469 RepID=UPI001CA8E170|nr:uncharacterized protein LOC122465458 [Chelonia mydas]